MRICNMPAKAFGVIRTPKQEAFRLSELQRKAEVKLDQDALKFTVERQSDSITYKPHYSLYWVTFPLDGLRRPVIDQGVVHSPLPLNQVGKEMAMIWGVKQASKEVAKRNKAIQGVEKRNAKRAQVKEGVFQKTAEVAALTGDGVTICE